MIFKSPGFSGPQSVLQYFETWMFYQIFLSPQVKRWAVISYKHGINRTFQLFTEFQIWYLKNFKFVLGCLLER